MQMTTIKLLSVLLIVISTCSISEANDSTFQKSLRIVPESKADLYKLIYQREQAEPVWVSIKDVSGNLLVNERFSKTDGFILPLNLEVVGSGTYNVEVRTKSDVVEETIVHTSKLDQLKERIVLQTNGSLMALVGFDLGMADLQMWIYDEESQLIHKESLEASEMIQKEYDLGELDTEQATVVVYHDSQLVLESKIALK